ncbi:MAG TPA: DUF1731 domain-containing protein [Prolixibacteraceae bacterium]|nr:DUF1731 domain-containing protein [Prolixibacteraceae bacterium]
MILALTGASGYIATYFREHSPFPDAVFLPLKRDESDEVWRDSISRADVIVNLAGYPVSKRWTSRNRKQILESRVHTTRRIVTILNSLPHSEHKKLFISASATGIYPDNSEEVFTESDETFSHNFLGMVVRKWESEAMKLENPLISRLIPVFKAGFGGTLGRGNQIMPFIHVEDILGAFRYFVNNNQAAGVYNLVAPQIITNKDFTKALAKQLKRPAIFSIPSIVLFVLFGNSSRVMLNGSAVLPARLLKDGFMFGFDSIEKTLRNIVF